MNHNLKCRLETILKYILILALVIAMIPAMPGEAASKKSKALAAYKKMLSKSRVTVMPSGKRIWDWESYSFVKYTSTKSGKVTFAIAYIDGDSVPELILKDPKLGYGIWTYKNGKVRFVANGDSDSSVIGYYKNKSIYRTNEYSEGTPYYKVYYKMSGTKSSKVLSVFDSDTGDSWREYYIGNKVVSKSKFNKKLKAYTGNKKMKKFNFYKNTKANRKKRLR